jgi:hypothetical protein
LEQQMDELTAELEHFRHNPTKSRRRKILSTILNSYTPGDMVEAWHEQLLREFVQRHPALEQKLQGQPISHFEVHLCTHGTKCFYMVRSDGKKIDFSYGKCL